MTGRLLSGPPAYIARTPWSAPWAVAIAVLVLLAATLLAIPIAIVAMLAGSSDLGTMLGDKARLEAAFRDPLVLASVMIGWQVLIVLFTWELAAWYGGSRREVLAVRGFPPLMTVVLAVIGGMALTLPFDVLGLTMFKDTVKADSSSFVPMAGSPWWTLFAIAITIGAPLSEEILFRGFLQSALARTRIGYVGAAILTSIGWTALHVQYSLFGLTQVLVIGLYFSWLLWRSGTLWLPITVHALYNSLSFALLKFGVIGG